MSRAGSLRPDPRPWPLQALAGLAVLAVSGALGAGALHATTVPALSEENLIDQAAVIVTGECVAVTTEWRERELWTLVTVEVTDTLKGEPGNQVTVRVPGGIDWDRRIPLARIYPGAPSFAVGERLLLFLDPALGADLAVTGFSQGKHSVISTPKGDEMAVRDLAGVRRVGPAVERRPARIDAVPLEQLKQRIRDRLAGR